MNTGAGPRAVLASPPSAYTHWAGLGPCPMFKVTVVCRVCRVETIFSHTFYFNWILIFLCEKRVIVPCTPCTHRILYSVYHQNTRRNQDFSFLHLFKGGLRPPETPGLQGA